MSDYHYRDTPDRTSGGGRPRRGSRGDAYYQQDGPRGGGVGYRDDDYYERPPPPPPRGGGRGGRGGRGGGGYDERRGPYGGGRGGGDYEEGGRGGKRRRSASPPPRGGGRRGDGGDDYYDSRPPPPGRNGGYDDGPRYRDDRREGYNSRPMNPDAAPFDPASIPARPMPTLEAPHQLPYPVTYRYFSDWFAQSSPPSLASSPEALADAWKKYEADLLRREAKAAFEGLKGWTWFKEKYAPGVGAKDGEGGEEERRRRERRGKQRAGREREWVEKVERGELEGLSFDFDESSVPRRPAILPNAAHLAATGQTPVKTSPSANGDASASSSTAREEKDPDAEEVKKENGAAEQVKDENGDASMSTAEEKPAVTPKKEDSASLPPTTDKKEGGGEEEKKPTAPASAEMVLVPGRPEQVVLSRVPGEVGVGELEALFLPLPGFLRLSLSEPAPHLRFIRLAWATFDSPESAQSALEEIQSKWVEPKEEEEVVGKKTENGEGQVKKEGAEEGGDEEMKDGEAATKEEKKDPEEQDASAAEDTKPKEPTPPPLSPYSIPVLGGGIYNLSAPGILAIHVDTKEARVRAAPALISTRERVRVDLENVERVVGELERRAAEETTLLVGAGEGEAEGEGKKGSEVLREKREEWEREVEGRKEAMEEEEYQKEMAAVAKRALDLSLSYLRSVHFSCYYCCVVCDSPEQLADMCPKHLRRADDGGNATRRQNEAAWAEGFDKRLPLLFPRDSLDVRDFGGESRDEELFRLVTPHVKQEEEGKFRCKECNKLFSARKFVEKHISLKHPDFIGDALDQVAFFNNYVLDPSRIPLAPFQCQSYLPSILAPPPPPPRPFNNHNTNSRSGGGALADRIGPKRPRIEPRSESNAPKGPPPPPPQGKSLDPRAGRGVSSYADLDGPGGGGEDIVLQY